jgi:hypothetical protein
MRLKEAFSRIISALRAGVGGLSPTRVRLDGELTPRLVRIAEASCQLDEAMAEIETRFAQISEAVENTTGTAKDLVEHGEALIALALGQGGGQIVIESTADQIWKAVGFVEENLKAGNDLIENLRAAQAQIGPMLASEATLVRTLAPLVYVQTLIRVESSGLPPDVQTMFQALVRDIEAVHKRVESEFHGRFETIREIDSMLGISIASLSRRQARESKTVGELRMQLTSSLERMKIGYEKNRDRNAGLAEVSRSLAQETGNAVVSLQFYDIVSQKLQHNRRILEEMGGRASAIPTGRAEACLLLRYLEQASRVSAAHLEAIRGELSGSGKTLSEGLTKISGQMERLNGDCVALRDLDTVTTGVDGAVQILLDSLTDMQKLVVDAEKFASDSFQSIEPISGKTTNFTSFIRNLSNEIQLIGLNAEVQSAHVGQGTGLEVLSAQASAISRETSVLSNSLAVEMDTFTARLASIVTAFRGIRDRSIEFDKLFASESREAAASLHDYRDSAFRVLLHIGELLPNLQSSVQAAVEDCNFAGLAEEPLSRLQEEMSCMAVAAGNAAKRMDLQLDTSALVEHFMGFYTMSGEGAVHRKALGFAEPRSEAPMAADDGIELFGIEDPPPGSTATPAPEATAQADVELWGEPPSAAGKPGSEGGGTHGSIAA